MTVDASLKSSYLQWDGSKVQMKTFVLFLLMFMSIYDVKVFSAVLQAVRIDISSFNESPTWKFTASANI